MNNELVYLVVGIFVVVIVVMIWNNKNENLYIPSLTPNQVYQGDYTNPMTTPNPRVWSCPSGTSGPGCCLDGKAGRRCRLKHLGNGGFRPPGGYGSLSPSEGYGHSAGRETGYGGAQGETAGEMVDEEGYHYSDGEMIDGEGYHYSDMEPASDRTLIDIIAPPFTDEAYLLGFGVGPGLLGSGRFTSEMFG